MFKMRADWERAKAKAAKVCSRLCVALGALALFVGGSAACAQDDAHWSSKHGASLSRQKAELLKDLKRIEVSSSIRYEFARAKPGTGYFDVEGTRAFPHEDGSCMVRMGADIKGRFTIVSALSAEMGLKVSPEMARQINLFEALHEVGHCVMKAEGAAFSHPALSTVENGYLGKLLGRGRGGELFAESFADAYAGLSMLVEARAAGRPIAPALDAVELVGAWRGNSRAFFEKDRGKPDEAENRSDPEGVSNPVKEFLAAERSRFDVNDGHQTDEAIRVVMAEREAWSMEHGDLSSRAQNIASRAVCSTLSSARWSDKSRPENLALDVRRRDGEDLLSRGDATSWAWGSVDAMLAWKKLADAGALRRLDRASPVVSLAVMRMVSFGKAKNTFLYEFN